MPLRAPTRRELVRAAAAGAGLAAWPLGGPAPAAARSRRDRAILRSLLALEQRAAFAYEALLRRGRLDARAARLLETFREHEREHAKGLVRALEGHGGRTPGGPRSEREVPGLERALEGGGGAVAAFALGLEAEAVRAYYEAVREVAGERLLPGLGSIMANEAQHLALARELAGRAPVPDAFETGARLD